MRNQFPNSTDHFQDHVDDRDHFIIEAERKLERKAEAETPSSRYFRSFFFFLFSFQICSIVISSKTCLRKYDSSTRKMRLKSGESVEVLQERSPIVNETLWSSLSRPCPIVRHSSMHFLRYSFVPRRIK